MRAEDVKGPPPPALVSAPSPTLPNTDNLSPAEATEELQAYTRALKAWQAARLAAVRAREGKPTIVVPPMPPRPKTERMTPDARQAALRAYQDQVKHRQEIAHEAALAEDTLRKEAGLAPDPAESKRNQANAITHAPDYAWRREA